MLSSVGEVIVFKYSNEISDFCLEAPRIIYCSLERTTLNGQLTYLSWDTTKSQANHKFHLLPIVDPTVTLMEQQALLCCPIPNDMLNTVVVFVLSIFTFSLYIPVTEVI